MMRVLCPAKINLHLRVGRRRADGFHPLLSWFTTVGLFDTLTVEDRREVVPPGRERAGAERILLLSSDLPGLAADESNLVVRAAEALVAHAAASRGEGDVKDATGGLPLGDVRAGRESGGVDLQHSAAHGPAVPTEPGVREGDAAPAGAAGQRPTPTRSGEAGARGVRPVAARLEKQIPLGAGLGGGSSDAARTLVALNRYWHLDRSMDQLAPIAAILGSDVPFFLYGPSSVCAGRGEIVKPVPPPALAKWVVLVLPDIHMPTAAVYGRFDQLGLGFDEHIEEGRQPDWREWSSRKSKDLLLGLVNDLERPAFEIRKDLGTLRADIELKLGRPVRMSGSGSSLFTLYDEKSEAEVAASVIATSFGVQRTLAIEMTPAMKDDLADAETNNVAPPAR
jgi:4-diphosphocytidyl-2-C-methyl-D-erythritol kinase